MSRTTKGEEENRSRHPCMLFFPKGLATSKKLRGVRVMTTVKKLFQCIAGVIPGCRASLHRCRHGSGTC